MSLPVEVYETVIDQASDNTTSLRHLSLACTTFLPRARYHLFTSIKIQTVQQVASSRDFLDSHPWLVPHIQKVILSILVSDESSIRDSVQVLSVVQVHLFTRLPNLRGWTMERNLQNNSVPPKEAWLSLHRSALRCYQKYSRQIRHLDLSGIPFDNISDFTRLVSAFTGIHSLTCSTISFRSAEEHDFSFLHDSGVNSRRLKVQTIKLSTSVDIRAIEYLLASGGVALNNLSIEVPENAWDPTSDYFERLLGSLDWIPRGRLSSVSFTIHVCWGHISGSAISRAMRSTAQFLAHIERAGPTDVRVEFKSDPISSLGNCLSPIGTLAETCNLLEKALLAFPACRILVHDPSARRRAGRAEFWSPIIHRAFPTLSKQGLLTIPRTKPDTPGPLGHEEMVVGLVASHDSKRIVTASNDGTLIIWNASRGTASLDWLAHRGSVAAFALSPDSRRLVSAGDLRSDSPVTRLAMWEFGLDGIRKVTAYVLQGYTEVIRACTWSSDGTLIASLSSVGIVRVWDSQTLQLHDLLEDSAPHVQYMTPPSVHFSPDARYLAWMSGYDCCVWQPLTGEPPRRLPSHPSRAKVRINAIAFAPNSKQVATAHGPLIHGTVDSDESVVRIWDIVTGAAVAVLAGHSKRVADVSYSPGGRSLVSASDDGSVRIWDAESTEQMACWQEDGDPVSKALFHPDGKHVAIVSREKRVKLWKIGDSACAAVFTEHRSPVGHIAFSPNGKYLASGDGEGVVRIRRLELHSPPIP